MPFIFKPPKIDKSCTHPEHNPPNMMVYKPGTYVYKCPACGKITRFTVKGYTC
jgi:hypothetical protein